MPCSQTVSIAVQDVPRSAYPRFLKKLPRQLSKQLAVYSFSKPFCVAQTDELCFEFDSTSCSYSEVNDRENFAKQAAIRIAKLGYAVIVRSCCEQQSTTECFGSRKQVQQLKQAHVVRMIRTLLESIADVVNPDPVSERVFTTSLSD